jgi:hypothetical protein
MPRPACRAAGLAACLFLSSPLLAQADALLGTRLPDEIEAVGGMGTAQGHVGAASSSELGAIRTNPAMLYKHTSYDVSGVYYWPSIGRPFYKAGIIDGMTSSIVAAFEYTGFTEELKDRGERTEVDSPVRRRGSVAFAVPTEYVSLGLAAHYVEAEDPEAPAGEEKDLKGISLGAGLVGQLTESLRLGLSVQNLNNRRVGAVAPRMLRAGITWEPPRGSVMLSVDYRERERSAVFETLPLQSLNLSLTELERWEEPERMGFVGLQVDTYDVLRVFASYGHSVSGPERELLAGGVGIFQKTYSLAYAVNKNFPAQNELQSSLLLSLIMKM